ncbi:MAG TPA: ABC transporter permease subunit [bacterium]|nr:ABC transporter permease subunit [bacterium]
MNARKLSALVRKELTHYFSSFMGYVVLFAFFLISGFFYFLIVTQGRQASMQPVFQNLLVILLFVTPAITMRLWSEEEKSGTAELLKTSPLTVWEIVIGKFLGVTCFFLVTLVPTFIYLAFLVVLGNPDIPPVFANYLGYVLAAMGFFAVGLLASTFTENQIISAIIAFGMLLLLWVVGAAGSGAQGSLGDFLKYLSIFEHTNDFFSGIIDLGHIVYFLSLIFLGLFFSVKVLEGKRN